ncbi:hypothetical protein INT47_001565 [Mucor saturninus]|uniref:DIS3-like exonuclease 2 n=1 Tax=Mucor saturninus TaxID=64648 RepID=A0A8H7QV97_9FUNG|nr:hypothetical protein INT47_001565 [Mucor saturninus]
MKEDIKDNQATTAATADVSVEKVKTRRLRKKKPTASLQQQQQQEEGEEQVVPTSEPIKKKKAPKPKKKKDNASSSSTTVSTTTELKQGEHVIDYQRLHDALRESFSIDERRGDIHFAPLTKATAAAAATKKYEKSPIFSMSSTTSSGRNCNQNAPSAKNRHAEIPPPAFMTTERLGKKKSKASKKSTKDSMHEKSPMASIPIGEENTSSQQEKTSSDKPALSSSDKPALSSLDKSALSSHEKQVSSSRDKSASSSRHEKQEKPAKVKKSKASPHQQPRDTDGEKAKILKIKAARKKVAQEDGAVPSRGKTKKSSSEEYRHPNDVTHGKNRVRFEPYVDPKICQERLDSGKYFKGLLRINKRNRNDAYVTCDNLDADVFIHGQRDRNRALEGDIVIIELLDLETIWAKKKESMIQKREQRHSTALERPPQEEGEDDKAKPKYVGKVVYISTPNKNNLCSGTLSIQPRFSDPNQEPIDLKNVRMAWFKPIDPRNPLIGIQLKNAPADLVKNEAKYKDLLMVAKITRWPIDSISPFGSIVRELGPIGNIVAETQAVLADNNIAEKAFGAKALNALPEVPWSIKQADINKRRDLRDTRIFTIDPATAKDLDDAVHVTKLNEEEFEVGVHIADVSHFVNQHTALDHEAFDRGTSTYLCDRVIPMLPSLLCEELCSLNPGVERLAFSVIWKMDTAGNIKDTWFGKTVIKSCVKLAYEDAQSVIENTGLPKSVNVKDYTLSQVEQDIQYLFKLSKQMRQRRFDSGALSINSIRLSFKLNELGEPCDVAIYEQKDANRLIEEFMLCANMSVAKKISHHYPKEALLRQHAPPHEKSLAEFIKIAENLGYDMDGSSAGSIQKSFNNIENEDVKAVLRLLAVKPMQRAKYFCTGSCDAIKYRHYALNVPLYTHFTSPIRRFADIIVHRQLEAALLEKPSCGYKKNDIQKAANHCNDRKEGAKNSQDMNIQLYLAHYLHGLEQQTQKPVVCEAIVTQVLKDCFEILVAEYGLEKRVHMDALPIERFVYDPHKVALAAYWKEGIESNREWDQGRKLMEDYVEPSGTQLYLDQDSNDEETATKTIVKIPQELLSEQLIDHQHKMQRFQPFSKITVRIQVNVEKSPPIVNIYPVNPFQ